MSPRANVLRRNVRACLLAALLAATLASLAAQTPQSAPNPSFDVASVKRNTSGDGRISFGLPGGGRFTVTNAPLIEIIRMAYQVQNFQLIGAPDWSRSERFDINAKSEQDLRPGGAPPALGSGGPPAQVFLMLRSLLAERFKLAVHTETRELPIYALVLARADKRLGPQLKPSDTDCAAVMAAARAAGAPPGPPRPGEPMRCGMMMGPGTVSGGSLPLSQFAQMLSQRMGRVVLDRTGLTGNYDFTISFTPDQMPQFPPGGPPPGAPPFPAIDPNGPSLATAVQEQLGLKLESTKGAVEVLVIDTLELPAPD